MLAELEFQQIVTNRTSNSQYEYLKKISQEIMVSGVWKKEECSTSLHQTTTQTVRWSQHRTQQNVA